MDTATLKSNPLLSPSFMIDTRTENGIPITTWIDNPDDEALLDLLPFLDALRFTKDVRSVLALRTM
jgi:TFIIF-interacting CTD phosphatase-like protein